MTDLEIETLSDEELDRQVKIATIKLHDSFDAFANQLLKILIVGGIGFAILFVIAFA